MIGKYCNENKEYKFSLYRYKVDRLKQPELNLRGERMFLHEL